ncbi:DUF732 domain-containing protein [Mycobacterium arosiense]|uniref:DUF732 domain-containing protein n=1 Tax=Mycobacterium arosiense ATCC BAA-1401 = DSM 45069 TaxID=1265311 RepID=A0A1W9ZBV7_MYCAI|nr:DUF732 domain-containing protein [Mycobacterium arosiense]ORA11283.1 hypothetical protein BST14_18950 [Mycobacterium arosiense ATCC BAA-1401 = DSM 45069]
MKATRLASVVAVAISLAAPAHADQDASQDADFYNQLRYYEVYSPHDFDRYIVTTICERLRSGNFPDALTAHDYLNRNIKAGTTEQQGYQILGTGIGIYCPDQSPKLKDMPAAAAAAAAAKDRRYANLAH